MTDATIIDHPTKTLRHKWPKEVPVTVLGSKTPSGCEQSERACEHCGLIKITVHPPQGLPYREWRHPASPVQFQATHTPPCREVVS